MKKIFFTFITVHHCIAFITSAGTGEKGDKSFTLSCLVPLQTVEIVPIPLPYLQYRWMVDDRAELGISDVLILPEFALTTCLVKK